MTIKVLFVCTANLCRSPMAEGVFRALVERAGMADAFEIASAGTSEKFVGQSPAPAALEIAASRGYDISNIRARQVTGDDVAHFDYPLAMDSSHLVEMRWLAPRALVGKPKLFLSFAPPMGVVDVADPIGGPRAGFERALSLIEAGCKGLLERVKPAVRTAI
ncbi:MAG: low molecular weight phosphotyrosine protein phosphatase [Reyranella sp.]|uniref:low molecular weight protein-tyrosine-phosphatase n=1 Tax=Reyranella sp. TaxID=1929291 RepID=UPI0012137CCB|nr:low molecular weight protein-tyrosine-phosphatase [Reyranella sp.]TAJ37969.1 MAG: low molecular weight phosphotyrosine protein phosphatase [Reyranella sp.]